MKRTSRRQKTFEVILVREVAGGWSASTPTLRGAYGQGATRSAAKANLMSAITDLLDTYHALGEKPPFDEVHVARVTRAAS